MFFRLTRLPPVVIVVAQETIRHDDLVRDIAADLQLTAESALSVRDAAIAIMYHGVSHLPVVDDGRLVGIVAFRAERTGPRRHSDPRPDVLARDGTTRCLPA